MWKDRDSMEISKANRLIVITNGKGERMEGVVDVPQTSF